MEALVEEELPVMVLANAQSILTHHERNEVDAHKVQAIPTGNRSAGPFWISRPDKSQFSSVPPIVTVPDRGLKAPRAPPRPPLPAGGMVYHT